MKIEYEISRRGGCKNQTIFGVQVFERWLFFRDHMSRCLRQSVVLRGTPGADISGSVLTRASSDCIELKTFIIDVFFGNEIIS